MSSRQNLQNALENGYELNIGDYISRAFEILNKNLGVFIVGVLLFIVAGVVISLPLTAIQAALIAILPAGVIGQFVVQIVQSVLQSLLFAPLTIGFAIAAHKAYHGREPEISDLFKGFSKYGPIVVVTLLVTLLTALAGLPSLLYFNASGFDITSLQSQDPEFWQDFDWGQMGSVLSVGFLISAVGIIIVSTLFGFAPFLVWFYDLEPVQALATSQKLASHNFLGVLGLNIVIGLVIVAGAIACCVGMLYTLPAGFIAQYIAFARITGLKKDDSEEMIDPIDHFNPIN
jgi:hypothetical protein